MLSCKLVVAVWAGKPRPAKVEWARSFLVLLLLLGMLAAFGEERSATAAEPAAIAVRISEQLPAECPREPTMLVRLQARLPHVREARGGEPAISIDVRVERRDGLNHATVALVFGGERAERTASSASCEHALTALAVMAAIGLERGDVTASAPEPPPPVAPTPERVPPRTAEPPAAVLRGAAPTALEPRAIAPPSPRSRPRLSFALGTGVDLSVNRAAVAMPGVFAQVRLPISSAPFLRIGFARSFWNDLRTARGHVGFRWSEATLTACSDLFHQGTVEAGPCLDAEAGQLEAVVVAPLPALVRATQWFSAGVAGRLAWRPVRGLSLEVIGGLRVPLVRAQLLFEPATLVYDPPLVVPFLSTAVVADLP